MGTPDHARRTRALSFRLRAARVVHWLVGGWLIAATLASAADGEPPPPRFAVVLPAQNAVERTRLADSGISIEAVGQGAITTLLDAEALSALLESGYRPISVKPLDFPPVDSDYHNFAEMVAEVGAVAAAHPEIIRVETIGLTVEGRELLAVKISDDPEFDDPAEPAVLFMALTHAREHLTVEMALATIHHFVEGYGEDPVLTNLVNQREIWVLPNVNPDGGEFDIASGSYQYWRKNRQPNPGGSFGVDLNRNYCYRWGGPGASAYPVDETYRGPTPFSEPETQAVRDFVAGHPDITAAISFHTYAELILYPYGYTYLDLPADMESDHHRAFVALANAMAISNGYIAQQASDLYVTSGDVTDWLYGERRIFGFTFEMYPRDWEPGFYPPGSAIDRETRRNLPAVTYLARMADQPLKSIGLAGDLARPTVTLTATPEVLFPEQEHTLLVADAKDDTGVTLVSWQSDGQLIGMASSPPFALSWAPAEPGPHVVQALALDSSGNLAASEPVTVTRLVRSQAVLALPDPPVLAADAPLTLQFSRSIYSNTLLLTLEPATAFTLIMRDRKAQLVHEPLRPSTAYTLTLASGHGPDSILDPAQWSFAVGRVRIFVPLVLHVQTPS